MYPGRGKIHDAQPVCDLVYNKMKASKANDDATSVSSDKLPQTDTERIRKMGVVLADCWRLFSCKKKKKIK